ncbi:hypothetical protein [Segatella baroniae]|uniref:hypothetical protein n=1 Tax=Segatella baroniae TaxID=305719 RepID=UPI00138E409C|nr:hypothetical protein [Segatella baroniae]
MTVKLVGRDFHVVMYYQGPKLSNISSNPLAEKHVLNTETKLYTPAKARMNENKSEKNAGASRVRLITLTLRKGNQTSISIL